MSKSALTLEGVHKRYGSVRALDDLSFEVPEGTICGFIGPNGSGKTTTFGIVGGAIRADKGRVDVLGQGPFAAQAHSGRLGLLPQDCELNPSTSVVDLLSYFARLQGIGGRSARRDAQRVLDAVHLGDRHKSRVGELSHGMRRRVALAQALLGDPRLILLDEPTSGLDPELVIEIKQLIRSYRGKSTVLVSSHVLSELESICDHVVILDHGRCRQEGSLSDVTGQGQRVRVLLAKPLDAARLRSSLATLEFEVRDHELVFTAPDDWSVPRLNASILPAILELGGEVLEIQRGESLEASYMATRATTN